MVFPNPSIMSRKFLILLFLSFWLSGNISAQKKLVFSTHWLPQAQFAGYYMAQKMGFYQDAGLNVAIIHPPATVNAVEYLQNGKADIVSLFLITAIEKRLEGLDIVNIAQMSEHSAIMFVAKKGKGIETLDDLDGKKIGIWKSGFEEVPNALVQTHGFDVEWVPIMSSVNLFLMDGIDLMTVMWYNEYDQIYLSGINHDEMKVFYLSEYDFDVPEDGLYVMEETFTKRRQELKAFVEASIRGWQYAAQHKAEALDEVLRLMFEAKIEANKAHQSWMLDRILEVQAFDAHMPKDAVLSEDDFDKALEVLEFAPDRVPHTRLKYDDFARPLVQELQKPERHD